MTSQFLRYPGFWGTCTSTCTCTADLPKLIQICTILAYLNYFRCVFEPLDTYLNHLLHDLIKIQVHPPMWIMSSWPKVCSSHMLRKYLFLQRVVENWNQLSNDEVNAAKTSGFKTNYDKKEAERRTARNRHPYVSGIRNYNLRVFTSVNP